MLHAAIRLNKNLPLHSHERQEAGKFYPLHDLMVEHDPMEAAVPQGFLTYRECDPSTVVSGSVEQWDTFS